MAAKLDIVVVVILVALCSAGVTALWRGRWRQVFSLFRINPRRMTVSRLGLAVLDSANVERVNSILASFLTGFNEMLTARTRADAIAVCDATPSVLQPFAHEGLAMGYTLRSLFRYDADTFEREIVKPKPEFRYLHYVGLGFWSGMRNHSPARVERIAVGLDPLHRFLVFDGYGFKVAFFDAPRSDSALLRLNALDGYARHAAWQGVGRALYFRFMDSPQMMIDHVRACGDHAADAAAGIGLAAVFVNPDRFQRAILLAEMMPVEWQPHVHLGMCFGLKARSINDVDQFEQDLARLNPNVQDAVSASIRECDRVELLVRADAGDDGYRAWRERVTAWMEREIEYPMRRVRAREERMRETKAGSAVGVSGEGATVRKGVVG